MDCKFFMVLLLISCLGFAYAVGSETCDELQAKCTAYKKAERPTVNSLATVVPGSSSTWPVTEQLLQEYRQLGEQHCREFNNTGYCLRELFSRCPESYGNHTTGSSEWDGWYDAEMQIALARVCETTIGPVKLHRAASHCFKTDGTLFMRCCYIGPDHGPDYNKQMNATTAHQKLCHRIKEVAERMSGSPSTDLVAKCGQDAVETIRAAYQQIHTAHC
ncbi:uncharacterized protein LOC129591516 [Paramacrobiotus metropolitanus]|uniref:uncharacterized protein LOC129591516 n=1 Tax=Paramacrobiotus metropolitanus TaxID=2943436 RepID=UPI00244575D9|nr:uncharacterized protein LOC129591516 [Paramacrobiotus metropolitanus]